MRGQGFGPAGRRGGRRGGLGFGSWEAGRLGCSEVAASGAGAGASADWLTGQKRGASEACKLQVAQLKLHRFRCVCAVHEQEANKVRPGQG